MRRKISLLLICGIIFSAFMTGAVSEAQVGNWTKEDIIEYTPLWEGERSPDGRPKVPDSILDRMEEVAIEEAWAVTERNGYHRQFESGWVMTHDNPVIVGRAVTAYYHPLRPDVNEVILADGERAGRVGAQNSWIIDTCVDGDVIVVDLMGKVVNGTFLGDNLANAISAKTGGNGVVVDGGARDIQGVLQMPDFYVFTRGWDPSFMTETMLMGINTTIRIGVATVMPGDIVLAKREGVIFIPAHLAEEVVETSEIIRIRDKFGHLRLRTGVYSPGQIDAKWTPEIEKDFLNWVKESGQEVTKRQMELLLKGRTF
ncbi:RraA family protein [Candidatus Latescibacterota bacterium]